MALDSRNLRGPCLHSSRVEEERPANNVARALELAREIEELLEETRSVVGPAPVSDASAHSTRMARAMAASLVDELQALTRPRKARTS